MMGPEAEVLFESLLQTAQVKQLDKIITLSKTSCTEDDLDELWQRAQAAGALWRTAYWNDNLSREENLQALGLTRLRTMSPVEDMAFRARAFYDPNTFEIAVSEARVEELLQTLDSLGYTFFTGDDIWNILIEHEVFHHIEERFEQPLDEKISGKYDSSVLKPFRDIGAYAFVNAASGRPPCQLLDFIWMKKFAPIKLAELLTNNPEPIFCFER